MSCSKCKDESLADLFCQQGFPENNNNAHTMLQSSAHDTSILRSNHTSHIVTVDNTFMLSDNLKNKLSDVPIVNTDKMEEYNDYECGKLINSESSTSIVSTANSDESNPSSIGYRDEWINVLVEDLVEWFQNMYPEMISGINVENFFDRISDGVLLCHHANELHSRLVWKIQKGSLAYDLRLNGRQILLPTQNPVYQTRRGSLNNAAISFVSRNNVSNFIYWCRQLGMCDAVLFESEDLVCKKNLRNVVICLLELGRFGKIVGLQVPELVKLEEEIDEEINLSLCTNNTYDEAHNQRSNNEALILEDDYDDADNDYNRDDDVQDDKYSLTSVANNLNSKRVNALCRMGPNINNNNNNNVNLKGNQRGLETGHNRYKYANRNLNQRPSKLKKHTDKQKQSKTNQHNEQIKQKPEIQRPKVDFRSLDELVRELLSQCTCKQTFPMIRVGEGRYLFGDKNTQIFVRILRNHVMVRVGGGWDTLSHFLSKYDECRKNVNNHQANLNSDYTKLKNKYATNTNRDSVDHCKIKSTTEEIGMNHFKINDGLLSEVVNNNHLNREVNCASDENKLATIREGCNGGHRCYGVYSSMH